jgi:hypothetical protein
MLLKMVALVDKAITNVPNRYGCTPLYCAARGGHLHVVEKLLEYGAEIDQANKEGSTPLQIATTFDRIEVVTVLRRAEDRARIAREAEAQAQARRKASREARMVIVDETTLPYAELKEGDTICFDDPRWTYPQGRSVLPIARPLTIL